MKKILFALTLLSTAFLAYCQPGPDLFPPDNSRKIQLAVLFDGSNSMDGLINQAKSKIWQIVNEVSTLRYNGNIPTIEIAIYMYGNDNLAAEGNYIQQLIPLTTDLDLISSKLFAIQTQGGSEYCGAVIQKSLSDLNWSSNPRDLKMIYIAGNESFAQGPIDYKKSCQNALDKQIFVNTIFCGNEKTGIAMLWQDGATKGQGDYFYIDTQQPLKVIETPYDAQINAYNDSLNLTYFAYGSSKNIEKKTVQVQQDANAASQAPSVKAERAIVKSKSTYNNASWDLLDAVENESIDVSILQEDQLPKEIQGKTEEEKQAFIKEKKLEREKYQVEIGKLAQQRQTYIQTENQKNTSSEQDDFGTSIAKSILDKASKLGFTKEI
jgi:hypothetical protein